MEQESLESNTGFVRNKSIIKLQI